MTAFFCASDNAARGSTLPDASFGAAVLSIVATHSSPMPGVRRAHCRRAGDDAVEERRVTLRHQHRLTAAGRAASEVRAIGRFRVMLRDDLFREPGDASHRLIGEVQRRLLLLHEAGVEPVLARVTGVGRDDGKAAEKRRRRARCDCAQWHLHAAVQAAAALKEEAAVPVAGQCERESDAVRLAVSAGSSIEHTIHAAVRRKLHRAGRAATTGRRARAFREPFGLRNR